MPGADRGELLGHRAECHVALGDPARARNDLLELRELGDTKRAQAIQALLPSRASNTHTAA